MELRRRESITPPIEVMKEVRKKPLMVESYYEHGGLNLFVGWGNEGYGDLDEIKGGGTIYPSSIHSSATFLYKTFLFFCTETNSHI